MQRLTADNVHHRTPVQIIEFFGLRHDEISSPERLCDCFSFRQRDGHHREWATLIFEDTQTREYLRRSNWNSHDRWLFQPRWRFMWKTEFPRQVEVPSLINP